MKKVLIFAVIVFAVVACQDKKTTSKGAANPAATSQTDPNAAEVTYEITTGQINWIGKKAVGSQHIGTLDVKSGRVLTKGNDVTGGEFVLDMSSIANTDLEGEKQAQLEGHLNSPDFFDVENHPEATFTITGGTQVSDEPSVTHEISGELSIKGITNAVKMPANISFVGDRMLVATPSFSIDRTKWDIKYGSGVIGTVADKVINDDIYLVATMDGQSK